MLDCAAGGCALCERVEAGGGTAWQRVERGALKGLRWWVPWALREMMTLASCRAITAAGSWLGRMWLHAWNCCDIAIKKMAVAAKMSHWLDVRPAADNARRSAAADPAGLKVRLQLLQNSRCVIVHGLWWCPAAGSQVRLEWLMRR